MPVYTYVVASHIACQALNIEIGNHTTLLLAFKGLVCTNASAKPMMSDNQHCMHISGDYKSVSEIRNAIQGPPSLTEYNISGIYSVELLEWLQQNTPSYRLKTTFLTDVTIFFEVADHEAIFKMKYQTYTDTQKE